MPDEQDGPPEQALRFPLSAEHEATLRTLGENVLRQSFEVLAEERVIPRSEHRPWIQGGRDYFGHTVRFDGPLSKALEAAIPDRFVRGPIDATMDYPWGYGHALLEAAVACATIADEPYDVSSPSVRRVIDQFIEKIQATPATTVMQVVSDIDVMTDRDGENGSAHLGETLRVAGVDIIRVGATAETYIEQELRSAGYDVEREHVVSWPDPTSLLVARVAEAVSFGTRSRMARRRLRNVTTAVRLATGASASPLVTIAGEPGNVRSVHPHIQPHVRRSMGIAYRPVALGTGDVAGLEVLCSRVDKWRGDDELETNPLLLAIERLNRSVAGPSTAIADIVIDLSVGLEAALSGADTSDVGLRLRMRAADLLATANDPGDLIYDDVKQLYGLRSALVHGSVPTPRAFAKTISRVSSAARSSHLGEQVEIALDRWRDLLRRAILVRAALASEPSFWPLKDAVDVDRVLRTESRRVAWLAHVRSYWADVGLASALDPVPPLRLTLSPDADQSSDDDRSPQGTSQV